ncbi:MAG: ABC transporter permease [Actinomycetota bacterium]
MKRLRRELTPPLAGMASLILIWAVLAALTSTNSIPWPADAWRALWHGVADGSLSTAAGKTLVRLAFGFGVSILIGTALGFALALNEFARRAVRPLVVALQITPFIAWLPLAVIWFGATERAVVFVTIMGAFPSMTLATIQAFRQVPPLYSRAGRTMGASGWTLYRNVLFPAALPGYMAGLQQAWGFAWKALMAAELIVAAVGSNGLGNLLDQAGRNVPVIVATVAVIALIGVAVDYLVFGLLDRRVRGKRGLLQI